MATGGGWDCPPPGQGEGEAANPHRPVPQGFEPWTFGSKVQLPLSYRPPSLYGAHQGVGVMLARAAVSFY